MLEEALIFAIQLVVLSGNVFAYHGKSKLKKILTISASEDFKDTLLRYLGPKEF